MPYSETVVKEMLVQSISCGDDDLEQILRDNVDLAYIINQGCHNEISYLQTQLALIDIAMVYSRNRVDEARTRAKSKGYDRFRSIYTSESKAQRTSQSHSCDFQDASSFQQFTRDSVSSHRSTSDMDSLATGETLTERWDRSTQQANGYSNVFDYAHSTSVGDGFGQHAEQQFSSGKSYSKTRPDLGPGAGDTDTGFVTVNLPSLQELFNIVTGITDWHLFESPGDTTFEQSGSPPNIVFQDSLIGSIDVPGPVLVTGLPFLSCCCDTDGDPLTRPCLPGNVDCLYDFPEPFPSYGRGYTVRYNLSIGVPWIGVLRTDWAVGEQFRQQHIFTQGCTRTVGGAQTNNEYVQQDDSESRGETHTKDHSETQRDIHTRGNSRRDSRSDTVAGSADTADAYASSESGSDRQGHSQQNSASQGTAITKTKGEGDGTTTSDSLSTTEVRKWGDIFKNLKQMWARIWAQIEEAEDIYAGSMGAYATQICSTHFSVPTDPIRATMSRKGQLNCNANILSYR